MEGRWTLLVLIAMTPIVTLAAFQGMLTAGLLPLAVFAPLYAVSRWMGSNAETARVQATRVVAASVVGGGLAIAAGLADPLGANGPVPVVAVGLVVLGAGLGCMAGLAAAPAARPLAPDEERRWLLAAAMSREHGRGLAVLFVVATVAGLVLGALRDLPLVPGTEGLRTIPEALFGARMSAGRLHLPSAQSAWALVVPLTLAPFVLGAMTPPRPALAFGAGGLAALLLVPLAVLLDLPVAAPGTSAIPLSERELAGTEVMVALAPIGAGLVLGAGLAAAGKHLKRTRLDDRIAWAAGAPLLALPLFGWQTALALACGLAVAAVLTDSGHARSPVGLALLLALAPAGVAAVLGGARLGLLVGIVTGIVAGAAALSGSTTRALLLPVESVR